MLDSRYELVEIDWSREADTDIRPLLGAFAFNDRCSRILVYGLSIGSE
jgi:hypothetical protein